MSLPDFSLQAELFSTAGLSTRLFAETDRYRLFGKVVYPALAAARPALEKCYCADNGRVALEPVLLLGVSVLQHLDGVPDRQALELLRYHAGWNFALNRQLGDPVFHPTSLVNFRQRLLDHDQSALGFTTVLEALEQAGLVSRQSRQRLDSTQMFGRVARMSRLDCVRESLRLALQELEPLVPSDRRPRFWLALWERYVESQVDYRASGETLARKLTEAGTDSWQVLQWLREPEQAPWATGVQAQLLARVFGEQFDVQVSQPTPVPVPREQLPLEPDELTAGPKAGESQESEPDAVEVPAAAKEVPLQEPELFVPSASDEPTAASVPKALPNVDESARSAAEPSLAEPTPLPAPAGPPQDKKELAFDPGQNLQESETTPAGLDEPFDVPASEPAPAPRDQAPREPDALGADPQAGESPAPPANSVAIQSVAKDAPGPLPEPEVLVPSASDEPTAASEPKVLPQRDQPVGRPAEPSPAEPTALATETVQPKDKKQLASDRVQNPHEPEATYAVKGQGNKKKEHVGYKIQVAESVSEAVLAPGEPTRNFLTGIVTHPAYQSDETGAVKMEAEQAAMGWDKPPVQYVDAAYVSAQELAKAAAEGRELIGPAPAAPENNEGRFTTEKFQIDVEARQAVCPAGKRNTQCSRLVEKQSDRVNFRFEWSTHCADCPLHPQCVAPQQKHRMIVVGEHHSALQARRQEQHTAAFKQRMKHRNGIEGTQSELVRGHGLRRARYRGLAKVKLQNYLIGAACNVKRWIRRQAWTLTQAVSASAAEVANAATV